MADNSFVKYRSLIEKWEQIALGDLLDDQFNEPLLVSKALHAFQELSDVELNEASYRTQIALLNASLIHQFDGACYGIGSKRFQDNFTSFDTLLVASEKLPKTANLTEFQRYAKSCFYYRIGDFLLLSSFKQDSFDKNQFATALCAYAIALDHQIGQSDAGEIHLSAESFNILELKLLLSQNLSAAGGIASIVEALRNNELGLYISSLIFVQKQGVGKFIASDLPKHTKLVDPQKIDLKKVLPEIWNMRRHDIFFKRFFWIRARLGLNEDDFLDKQVTRFNAYPKSSSVYDVQDFSLFDLKLLIYRISVYIESQEIKPKVADKTFLYPPHFQSISNKQFVRIWAIVNTLLDNGTYNRDRTSDRISFVSMLEELRQYVPYDSDKLNLTKSLNYIWDKILRSDKLPNSVQQTLSSLFERYANAVLDSKYDAKTSTLFSHYGEFSDLEMQDLRDNVHSLLAQHAVRSLDLAKAKSYLDSISETGQNKESVKLIAEAIKQRDSKNASPDSIGSFQMVEASQIEENSQIEDTFLSCNESTSKHSLIDSSHQQSTILNVTHHDDTINVSKVREELESEVKQQLSRKLLCSILDDFIAMSVEETKKLKNLR